MGNDGKLNDSQRITLTFGQLLRLVSEATLSDGGNKPKRKQDAKKQPSWGEIGRKNIAREIQRLKTSGAYQKFMDTFIGSNEESISIRTKRGRIKAVICQGNRDVGTHKIINKHLIDGLTAYTGGFTLAELNKSLPVILKRGIAIPDEKGMRVSIEVDGLKWIFGLRRFGGGDRWTISSIYTSRDKGETGRLVSDLKQKSLGHIASDGQKDQVRGQPDK